MKRGFNNARWGGALHTVVDLALLLALGGILAQITWTLLAPRGLAAPAFDAAPSVDAAAIAARQLFGAPESGRIAGTASGIRLLGVASPRRAILAVGGERPRALAVGDSAAPGVVLVEVQADHVVISRNGALERIVIERRGGRGVEAIANARR